MNFFVQFLSEHATHAHWFIFLGLLLAGCNIPISIDLLVIVSALIASKFIPENLWILYATLLIGCSFSAWISYFLGKSLGDKLKNWKIFKPILSENKIASMQIFYQKYGVWTFIIGRFIPFGVRNALFMTSGMSKMPFRRFIMLDAVACFIWLSLSFSLFFQLGQNFETLWEKVKTINTYIFITFSLAVIVIFWYKKINRTRSKKSNSL
ncbi:MAG: DedA family protein [Verrucomicrobia bacterium]|nr:DedA family protein [Verrucomicrobiota bacterium]